MVLGRTFNDALAVANAQLARQTRPVAPQCKTNEELVNNVCKCKSGYIRNSQGQCVLNTNSNNNTSTVTVDGAGSKNSNQSKTDENRTTLTCDKIQRLTYIELEGLIRDNKVDFGCKEYPCDGLTEQQQSFLKQKGWTLSKCPCPDGKIRNENDQCVDKTRPEDTPNPKEEPPDPFDTTGLCPEGFTYDSGKKECVPVTVCGPGTTLNDKGQCVSTVPEIDCPEGYKLQEGQCVTICGSGRYWNVSSRTCLPIPNCPEGYSLNQATGKCEPECNETQYYDEDANQCRPRRTCGNGTKANAYNQCVPICSAGQYYDSRTGKCVPSPTCSQEAGTTLDPKTNQCVSICQPGKEYWNGKNCEPIPSCGKGTRFNQQTGQCESSIERIECGQGTIEINGQCVPIETEPPLPPPPPVDITINLPPDSGNPIIENPDPDNSAPTSVFLAARGCEDLPPPPPPPPPADKTRQTPINNPTGKHLYVLQNKVGAENTYINAPYSAEGVDDVIRGVTGYFWYFDDRVPTEPLFPVYRQIYLGNIPTQNGLTRYFLNPPAIGDWSIETFPQQKTFFKLTSITNSLVKNKITNLQIGQYYQDQVFYANVAKNGKEIPENISEPYVYESKNVYNYYINSYEKLLESPSSPQSYQLPNFYLLRGKDLGQAAASSVGGRNIIGSNNQPSLSPVQKSQYYDDYVSKALAGSITTEKMKNIFFESNERTINTIDDEYVPFYNKISFTLEKERREIYNFAGSLGVQRQFLNIIAMTVLLIEEQFSPKNYAYRDSEKLENTENKELYSILYDNLTRSIQTIYNRPSSEYINRIRETTVINNLDHSHQDYKSFYNSSNRNFIQTLIRALTNQRRKFMDILQGKESYSETLLYKIEKYEEGIEEPVQNIWLTNDEKDIFDYIDTQVKYNTEYTYVVKSYRYVLGNQYRYTKKEQKNIRNIRGDVYDVESQNYNQASIVVTEYARISGIVIDKPPPAPEIDVIPYKDNSEKVLVLFNPSTVQYRRKPVAFTDSEAEFYERVLRYQDSQDEKITFGGDDKTTKYLVYKIEHHPSSYEDFYNALYAEIDTECNCTTAEYVQDLEANKKYYYVFRSVDVHGHLSYPTQPFLVELINEAGTTFLDFRGVDFIDKDYKSLTKPVKRFIHIKPNLEQALLNVSQANVFSGAKQAIEREGAVSLGQEELTKSVWDKNFKLRIKSKNTNKEINVKFKFVQKKNTDLIRNLEESCE